jgi:hypothetical protein
MGPSIGCPVSFVFSQHPTPALRIDVGGRPAHICRLIIRNSRPRQPADRDETRGRVAALLHEQNVHGVGTRTVSAVDATDPVLSKVSPSWACVHEKVTGLARYREALVHVLMSLLFPVQGHCAKGVNSARSRLRGR